MTAADSAWWPLVRQATFHKYDVELKVPIDAARPLPSSLTSHM
jgi:hypothetical protein